MRAFIFLSLFFSIPSWAVRVEILGPCSSTPLFVGQVEQLFKHVGQLTVHVLNKEAIPYDGNEIGLHSIYNTPTGLEALEVISDTEMKAYGWCYEIDGKIPEVLPKDFPLTGKEKTIKWFFGHAHYLQGNWVSQCEKSYLNPPSFLCPL